MKNMKFFEGFLLPSLPPGSTGGILLFVFNLYIERIKLFICNFDYRHIVFEMGGVSFEGK